MGERTTAHTQKILFYYYYTCPSSMRVGGGGWMTEWMAAHRIAVNRIKFYRVIHQAVIQKIENDNIYTIN